MSDYRALIEDDFNGVAGDVTGRVPNVGVPWSGSGLGKTLLVDGSGAAVMNGTDNSVNETTPSAFADANGARIAMVVEWPDATATARCSISTDGYEAPTLDVSLSSSGSNISVNGNFSPIVQPRAGRLSVKVVFDMIQTADGLARKVWIDDVLQLDTITPGGAFEWLGGNDPPILFSVRITNHSGGSTPKINWVQFAGIYNSQFWTNFTEAYEVP